MGCPNVLYVGLTIFCEYHPIFYIRLVLEGTYKNNNKKKKKQLKDREMCGLTR